MSLEQRELVGDLDKSTGYNEERRDGDESTEGMADVIDDLLGGEGDSEEPDERSRPSVRIRAEPTQFVLQDPPDDVDTLLYDTLAYEDPDARWTPAYKQGRWDGVERLYDRDEHAAAIGHLPRATDALDAEGYPFAVTDNRGHTGEPINPAWKFDHDLRDYQQDAVQSVIDAGGGLVIPDVDDYAADDDATAGLDAINALPDTLTVETPHTDGETGGHRYYRVVPGDEFDSAKEACEAVWGESKPVAVMGRISGSQSVRGRPRIDAHGV